MAECRWSWFWCLVSLSHTMTSGFGGHTASWGHCNSVHCTIFQAPWKNYQKLLLWSWAYFSFGLPPCYVIPITLSLVLTTPCSPCFWTIYKPRTVVLGSLGSLYLVGLFMLHTRTRLLVSYQFLVARILGCTILRTWLITSTGTSSIRSWSGSCPHMYISWLISRVGP